MPLFPPVALCILDDHFPLAGDTLFVTWSITAACATKRNWDRRLMMRLWVAATVQFFLPAELFKWQSLPDCMHVGKQFVQHLIVCTAVHSFVDSLWAEEADWCQWLPSYTTRCRCLFICPLCARVYVLYCVSCRKRPTSCNASLQLLMIIIIIVVVVYRTANDRLTVCTCTPN